MFFSFIFWTFIFSLVGGLLLYLDADIPWLMGWVGKLPGDMQLTKDELLIFFPVTSAALASLVFTFILQLFKRKN